MMAWRVQGRKGLTRDRDGGRPPGDAGQGADSTLKFSEGVGLPPGDIWPYPEIFFISQLRGRVAPGI